MLLPSGICNRATESKGLFFFFFFEIKILRDTQNGQSGQSLTVLDTSPLCQINWKRARSQKTELSSMHATAEILSPSLAEGARRSSVLLCHVVPHWHVLYGDGITITDCTL